MTHRRALALTLLALSLVARPAAAQSLGTFVWQLAPYCNVVTLNTTQDGAVYTFDGYDNQCGASTLATTRGLAVVNPNGTVGIGLTIVTSPGALPVHVQATIDLGSLGGPWNDDHGNTGTLIFAPAAPSGSPRPVASAGIPTGAVTSAKIADGTVAAIDVNAAEVQKRVSGTCPASQLMTGVNQDGTVVCAAVSSSSGGDITGVLAGAGLIGGGTSGDVTLNVNPSLVQARVTGICPVGESIRAIGSNGSVTCEPDDTGGTGDITGVTAGAGLTGGGTTGTVALAVNFAGGGAAATAARSDHQHQRTDPDNTGVGVSTLAALTNGTGNTALGASALAAVTSGLQNTGLGIHALLNATTGGNNVAVGAFTASSLTTGLDNTAVGTLALRNTTVGAANTAVGYGALNVLGNGNSNVAVGEGALVAVTTGDDNIALGRAAGQFLTTGSGNLYVGNWGAATESATTRIGNGQSRTFITGIRGVTTGNNNGLAVVVDSAGQLGTVSSSAKTKFDIQDLSMDVVTALGRLRPVSFRYKQPFADGSTPVQYGLIAEEVQEVLPELVALDDQGEPASVKYHVLPALLLAEVQRLRASLASESARTAALESAVAELRSLLVAARQR